MKTDRTTLRAFRHAVRAGETPPELVDELRQVARRLARTRRLPPSFAPYGQWDDEAADEIFASWYAERLVHQGRLLALLDRSPDLASLKRIAERSLRQHLLNSQDRSQARNLFSRLVTLLGKDTNVFAMHADAARPQDRWYRLAEDASAQPWAGPERLLIAHAWALGDFATIRYRAAAAKLSPVLDVTELQRFASGLLGRTEAALTPTLIMRALSHRFALGDSQLEPIDDQSPPAAATRPPDAEVLLSDTARGLLDELTPRQATVLIHATEPVADIARRASCSVGTVVNEQRRIGLLVIRASGDDEERDALLNLMADLLYEAGDV
jgi:hypothetical protein